MRSLRSKNRDPAHGRDAAKKRSETNRRQFKERKVWEDTHSPAEMKREQERFRKEILPTLALTPVSQISRASRLSLLYASIIRRGEVIPHPVHYGTLAALVKMIAEAKAVRRESDFSTKHKAELDAAPQVGGAGGGNL